MQTQNVVGMNEQLIELLGKTINDTDDVIKDMKSSEFPDDLTKYQDVSKLARTLFSLLMSMPRVNRQVTKMMAKLMNGRRKGGHGNGGGWRRPGGRPQPPDPEGDWGDDEGEGMYRKLCNFQPNLKI